MKTFNSRKGQNVLEDTVAARNPPWKERTISDKMNDTLALHVAYGLNGKPDCWPEPAAGNCVRFPVRMEPMKRMESTDGRGRIA